MFLFELTFYSVAFSLRTTKLKIKKFYIVHALLWVFFTHLRTNSGLYFVKHEQIGFYSRGGKCLQRGTDWVFK